MLPQPTEAFEWVQAPAGPALVCRPLASLARHLFTTRPWPLGRASDSDSEPGWSDVANAIGVGAERLARVHQVHGSHAVQARPGERPDADIVFTHDSNIAVAIQTADCIPLLIVDSRTGAIAAVHAGWRGLAERAPVAGVKALADAFGTRPADLIAGIGPAIGACCYEVGADVHRAFDQAGFSSAEIRRWFSDVPRPTSRNPSMPAVPATPRKDHWYFDGWICARDQLAAAGVGAIHIAELCTASHPDVLCSYRRDGKPAGRMAAVVRCGTPGPSPHSRADPRER